MAQTIGREVVPGGHAGRQRLDDDHESVVITFRTPSPRADAARSLAARQGVGIAALMREALDQYLAAHQATPAALSGETSP